MSETKYQVKTDELFFLKFEELSYKIKALGAMFQNENIIVSIDQLDEWVLLFKHVTDELDSLKYEAITERIQLYKQEEK